MPACVLFVGVADQISYRAYCDMTNGGWQLAMRAAKTSSTFLYASAYWENTALLNAGDFAVSSDKDAKFATFVEAPVKYMRGCFAGDLVPGECNMHALPKEYVREVACVHSI
jgi:hypothetical protein